MTGTDASLLGIALTAVAVAALALPAGAAAGTGGGVGLVPDDGGSDLSDAMVSDGWTEGVPLRRADEAVEGEAEGDGSVDADPGDLGGAGLPDDLPVEPNELGLDGSSDEDEPDRSDSDGGKPDPGDGRESGTSDEGEAPESGAPDDGDRPPDDRSEESPASGGDRDARPNQQATPGNPVGRPTATPMPSARPTGQPTTRPTPTPSTQQPAVGPAAPGPLVVVTDVRPNRSTVPPGQAVAVEAHVVNRADQAERVPLAFRLFGEVIDVREMQVPAGGSRTVRFVRSIDAPGLYHPAINGVETTVRVTGGGVAERRTPASGGAGPGFTGPVAFVAFVAAGLLARRR